MNGISFYNIALPFIEQKQKTKPIHAASIFRLFIQQKSTKSIYLWKRRSSNDIKNDDIKIDDTLCTTTNLVGKVEDRDSETTTSAGEPGTLTDWDCNYKYQIKRAVIVTKDNNIIGKKQTVTVAK